MDFIPVCEPLLLGNEARYVEEALSTNWISSSGRFIKALEEQFAAYIGTRRAVSVCNGTAALHLACAALELGPGDEVILPDFTMIASAFAVCYTGATPVFVDAEARTWNIDPALIEEKITPRTRAIMPVHIYGHPCGMAPIRALAEKHGLAIIEDAAEVHGAEQGGRRCGAMGTIACFSLYANKIITSGEGGLVTTDDDRLYDRCRLLKNLSFPIDGPRDYLHAELGFNYRMTNVQAAIALAQLERIDEYVARRIANAALYAEGLARVPGLRLQPTLPGNKNVYWMNGVVVEDDFGLTRDELARELREAGVDSRPFFQPMHAQPALHKRGCPSTGAYPVSLELARRGLYLPSGSGLTPAQIGRVCETVAAIQARGARA